MSGLVPSTSGRIVFDGQDITKAQPHAIRRAGLVHIPEGRGIFPGLSVQENLRMAVRRVGTPEQRKSAIEHAYDMFPRLAERRNQRAGTLSGGEQQMLALARALAVPPKLIIADEMSLGLAPLVVDFVFESIEQAAKNGVTIVLIEQFMHRALGLASECVILKQGIGRLGRSLRRTRAKRCSTATSASPPTQWRKASPGRPALPLAAGVTVAATVRKAGRQRPFDGPISGGDIAR